MALEDSDVQKLSTELKAFTKGLEKFNNASKDPKPGGLKQSNTDSQKAASSFDKSTQKIVNALALLSTNLTRASATEREKRQHFNEFNKAVVKSTKLQQQSAEASAASVAAAKQAATAAKATVDEERDARKRASESIEDTAKRYAKALGSSSKAFGTTLLENSKSLVRGQAEAFTKSDQYYTRAGELFANSLTSVTRFGTGLIQGADSFQSLNTVVGILGKSVGGLVGLIPFIGGGLTKLSEAGTEVAKTMIDQFSANLNSFKELSDIGLASSFSDMQKTATETGLLFADINKSLGKYTVNLAQFGGSVSGGKKIFSDLSKEMEPFRQEFRAMGISTQEFAEYQAMYLAREGKLGLVKDRDAKQLSEGTKKYIDELDVLSKLTGENRKSIQAKMDESMAESQYTANMELLKNNPRATDDLRAFDLLMRKEFGDEFAKGMRNNLGGVPTTESGNVAFMQTGGESVRIQAMLKDGTIDLVDAINQIKKSVRTTLGPGSGAANLIGVTGDLAGSPYSNYAKLNLGMNAKDMQIKDIEDARKAAADAKAKSKDLKTIEGAAANAQEAIYKSATTLQDAFSSPAGLTAVVNVASSSITAFSKAVDEVTKKFGGKTVISPTVDNTRPNGAPISHDIKGDVTNNLRSVKVAMMKRGEKDENYLTAAIANVMKESGGINQVENLGRYANTDNAKIKEIFGDRASSMPAAELNRVKADPKLFAQAMYGGEWGKKNLGNMTPDDAWTYRGRGYIQLTGKSNYAEASRAIYKDDRLVKNPDLITEDAEVSAAVTAWFFERGKQQLAKPMGISENNMSRRDAAVLTTSIVAGGDIRRKKDYIKNDLLNKVEGYANNKEIQDIKPTSVEKDLKQSKPDWAKTSSMVKSKDEALALLNFSNQDTGKRENFLQLNEDIQQKVLAAAEEYNKQTGSRLQVNSAKRTFEDQARLRDDWETGKSKIYAAPAGTSLHESGNALDIQQGADGDVKAIAALNRQGLSQKIQGDPVHFQARTGGIFKGPSTGYNVTLHDEEVVVPASEGVSKQALNSSVFNQNDTLISDLSSMFEKMNEKYDTMIELLANGNEYSEKLVAATV